MIHKIFPAFQDLECMLGKQMSKRNYDSTMFTTYYEITEKQAWVNLLAVCGSVVMVSGVCPIGLY